MWSLPQPAHLRFHTRTATNPGTLCDHSQRRQERAGPGVFIYSLSSAVIFYFLRARSRSCIRSSGRHNTDRPLVDALPMGVATLRSALRTFW